MKWEYVLVPMTNQLKIEVIEEHFNKAGLNGWELVSVDNGIAYFRRELRNVSKPKITHITDDNSARVTFKQSYDD